jgi:phage-related protein
MKGVKFGNYHSYYEWGLILSEKEIGSPKPKTKYVEVEGSDSVLDYTEYFGDVKYENRTLSFVFAKANIIPDGFLALFSVVQDALQGKKMQIILDDDPSHYYLGRVSINEWKSNKNIGEIVIECDCEPYKYKVAETVVTKAVTGSSTITLNNSRKKVVPKITTSAQMTISFNGYTGTFSAGTFTIPELELVEGANTVTVTGTGNISFVYREGRL